MAKLLNACAGAVAFCFNSSMRCTVAARLESILFNVLVNLSRKASVAVNVLAIGLTSF
ncbi:hypothetical protein [Enterococcus cecorum]|uniref:hypothetical protein n=1 Tax=Enterococcus cecorum TaxID=44008 RepID=UPI001AD83523|nr:hypothetical protein [Enterococcus cecorum]